MTKTKIIEKLLKAKNNKTNTFAIIDELLNDLQTEIMNEKNKDRTLIQKTNKAKAFLKGAGKTREVLSFSIIENGYQYFTDSIVAFKLKEHLILNDVNKYNEENKELLRYPNIERLFSNLKSDATVDDLNIDYYLNKLKAKKYNKNEEKEIFENENIKICFDVKKLKMITDILGTSNLLIKCSGKNRALYFIDEKTGNEALLCLCRC